MRSDMVAERLWLDMNRNSRKICTFTIDLLISPHQIIKPVILWLQSLFFSNHSWAFLKSSVKKSRHFLIITEPLRNIHFEMFISQRSFRLLSLTPR
jgi:hypothetical protein